MKTAVAVRKTIYPDALQQCMDTKLKIVLGVIVIVVIGAAVAYAIPALMNSVADDYPIQDAIEAEGYDVESFSVTSFSENIEGDGIGTAHFEGTFKTVSGESHHFDVTFSLPDKTVTSITIS